MVPWAPMPALLTSTSIPPSRSAAASTALRIESSSVTSAVIASIAAAPEGSRSRQATAAPRAAMVREVSRPIPEAPPVTTAASPANSSLIRAPLGVGGGERGHGRVGAGQPPPGSPGGLVAARHRAAGAARRRRQRLRALRGHGPARALPGASYLAGFSNGFSVLWPACAGFVLLLTPTGSLPSPRWRWWAWVAAAATVMVLPWSALDPRPLYPEDPTFQNPLALPAPFAGPLAVVGAACAVIVLAAPVAGAWSLVLRFRRGTGVERQQLRWLAAVALLVAVGGVATSKEHVVQVGVGVCMLPLPLATGAPILRYRLYDLDRIISRTLAYGLLTVLLGGGYAGVVLGLGQLLGQDSSLVVAGATLAVAGLFQPARRRVQQVVDRRFNRRRYDAARTIEGFSARLRQQVDLDTLTGELLGVVEQTVQPTSVSLWLRASVSTAPDQPSTGPSRATAVGRISRRASGERSSEPA